MIKLLKKLLNYLLIPINAFKYRYLSIIIIYFIYGLATFNSIAEMFWVKNKLSLTPQQLIEIAFWSNLAWTFKIFFSYMLDSTKLFKGDKKCYIVLSNISLMLGYFILALTVYDIKNILCLQSVNYLRNISLYGPSYTRFDCRCSLR